MGLLALALFHLSHSNIFLKIPHRHILFRNSLCFWMKMLKFFVCVMFAATSVTILSGRPTKEEEMDGTLMSSYFNGTVVEPEPEQSRVRRHFGEYTSTSTEQPTNSTTAITKPAYIRIQSRLLDAPTTTTSETTTTTEEPTPNPSTWIVWTTTTVWWDVVKGVCSWCVPDKIVDVNHWG